MAERTHLTIGEVLTLLREEFPDVSISKIRFLESQGLVDPERTPSGYRKFYDHDVERLRWILQQQREHFLPLKVIRGRLNEQRQQGGDGPDGPPATGEPAATAEHNGNGNGAGAHTGAPGDAGGTATAARPDASGARGEAPSASPEPTGAAAPVARHAGAGAGGGPAAPGGPPRAAADAPPAEGGPTSTTPAGQPAATGAQAPGGAEEGTSSAAGERAASGARPEPARAATEGSAPVVARAASPAPPAPPASLAPAPPGSPPTPASSATPSSSAAPAPSPANAAPASAERATAPAPGAGRATPPSGPGQPDVYTTDELAAAAGCEPELVADLQQFGLLTANATVRGVAYFDPEALTVARTAARFAAVGVEPRHLRAWRTAADREVSLFEQLVMPLLRQRNPQSRKQAAELLERLAHLGADLRAELVREGIARIR